jgi:hypothetical protein
VRALALIFCGFALLVLSPIARGDTPATHHVGKPDGLLAAENARLENQNARLRRKLRKGERLVRHLRRANRQRLAFGAHGVTRGFLCIHMFEGAWNDPSAPYWGGVQMDLSFQRTYGRVFLKALGTADHWPAFIQVAVAMSAYYSGRGYYPWPNTARYCGLL